MFWLGLILPVSYIPLLTGKFSLTGWLILSIVLPWFFTQPLRLNVVHYLGLAFLGYATLSALWAPILQQAIYDLWITYMLAGLFLLGLTRDCRDLILGLACGVSVSTFFAIPQFFGWGGIYQTGWGPDAAWGSHMAGLFVNKDMFGEAAALVSIALLCERIYWPIPLTVPPILFTECRTAMLATCAVISLWCWNRWRWHSALLAAPLAFAFLAFAFRHGWDGSADLRISMWRDTISGFTFFGRGAGSFFMLFPEFAAHSDTMAMRPESVHNDYLELIFEYGIGTAPLAAILAVGASWRGPHRFTLVAFLVIAFFSFPIRMPVEGLLGMVALGSLCRDRSLAWPDWLGLRSIRDLQPLLSRRAAISMEPLHAHHSGLPSNLEGWTDSGRAVGA